MSQEQFDEQTSETAEQLNKSLELLLEFLLEEKKAQRQASASKEQLETKQSPEESEQTKATLAKNAATQQSSQSSAIESKLATLEQKLLELESQFYRPTEIIDPLLPLITELLQNKTEERREYLLQTLIPIIDEVIRQKAAQYPLSIGKAIAPEIAFAIQEQILLERESISRVLGPQMGEAIKNQIVVERDAMVDALYPVIGNTISKYMVEVVKDINKKVENTLSPEGFKRKIRAKIQGVSEAELIFQEVMEYAVLAVFLIHKDSGLVIRDVQPESSFQLEADMIAGMLTAIRVFVNDSVAVPGEVSELHEIEYDASKIIIEVAGYCYLAVVVKGEPSKALLQKIRDTLGTIILDYGRFIEEYSGDPGTIPDSLQPLLVDLVETKRKTERASSLSGLLFLGVFVFSLMLLPLGFIAYRNHVANQNESEIAAALDATPELSVYRLVPNVRRDEVTLTGRVPSQYLRTKAARVASEVVPDLELNNQIIAVDIPLDPELTAAEVERTTELIDRRESVNITTRLDGNIVRVAGSLPEGEAEQIVRDFEQIPGVRSVIVTVGQKLPTLDTRIYFEVASAQLDRNALEQISTIERFLARHPNLHLNIIGYSDSIGARQNRENIALRRARAIQQTLIERGAEPSRLQALASSDPPPDVTESEPSRWSRVVRFETVAP